MKIFNQTPDTCEKDHIKGIFDVLKEKFNDDWGLYVRRHEQPVFSPETKYGIVIILSAEGHTYLPPETNYGWVAGVFMNYLPKNASWTSPGDFVRLTKLYALPLGTTDWFKPSYIPIEERLYDFSFIGQYDPYTRQDFYECVGHLTGNKFIYFYEGWNKGLGAEEYSRVMSQTKIALVPCGSASLDTFRFYEAASCGCIILTKQQNNYDFMQNSPHLPVPSWSSGVVSRYISKLIQSDLEFLSKKTKKFWEDHLSPPASAKYIMEKLYESGVIRR